jgi:hypothetical protein
MNAPPMGVDELPLGGMAMSSSINERPSGSGMPKTRPA